MDGWRVCGNGGTSGGKMTTMSAIQYKTEGGVDVDDDVRGATCEAMRCALNASHLRLTIDLLCKGMY